jgi:hypothetical protein
MHASYVTDRPICFEGNVSATLAGHAVSMFVLRVALDRAHTRYRNHVLSRPTHLSKDKNEPHSGRHLLHCELHKLYTEYQTTAGWEKEKTWRTCQRMWTADPGHLLLAAIYSWRKKLNAFRSWHGSPRTARFWKWSMFLRAKSDRF